LPPPNEKLKTAGAIFKMGWLGESFAAAADPISNPRHHLAVAGARFAEKRECFLCVAEKGVRRFDAIELRGLPKPLGKIFRYPPDAEEFRASDVENERRAGCVKKRLQAHRRSVALPHSI